MDNSSLASLKYASRVILTEGRCDVIRTVLMGESLTSATFMDPVGLRNNDRSSNAHLKGERNNDDEIQSGGQICRCKICGGHNSPCGDGPTNDDLITRIIFCRYSKRGLAAGNAWFSWQMYQQLAMGQRSYPLPSRRRQERRAMINKASREQFTVYIAHLPMSSRMRVVDTGSHATSSGNPCMCEASNVAKASFVTSTCRWS